MDSPLPYHYKLNVLQDYHRSLPTAPGKALIDTEYKNKRTEDSFPVGEAAVASQACHHLSTATNM